MKTKVLLIACISISYCTVKSAEATTTAYQEVKGRKLYGEYSLMLQKEKATTFPFSNKKIRVEIIPGEGFTWSEDDHDEMKNILLDSTSVFLKLPDRQNPISLSAFVQSLNDATPQKEKAVSKKEMDSLIDLFFDGNKTPEMFKSFTFSDAFKVTLPNGKPGLVLKSDPEKGC